MNRRQAEPRWLRPAIAVGAALFVFALVLSAVFEPSIRVLHTLQALIYVTVVVLTLGMAYFIGVIFMTGPQYIPLLRRTFGF